MAWKETIDGWGHLECLAFRKDQFRANNLLADICARVGADQTKLTQSEHRNQGLSLEATAVLAVWHKHRADRGLQTQNPAAFGPLVEVIRGFGEIHDWGLAGPRIEKILRQQAADVKWAKAATGCPEFADEPAPAHEISSVEHLLSYGNSLDQKLSDWLNSVRPDLPFKNRNIVSMLEDLHASFFPRSTFRGRAGRLLRRAGLWR